ncbi:MAG: M23 family metallopeptidase [Chitinophagaceae bacterium]
MKKLVVLIALNIIAVFCFAYIGNPSPAVIKSLVFPVSGKKSNIGSFWGDVRDGGKRKHQGIDIFAKKGTPVVAITDGIIVAKGNTPRGGKTLWLQAAGHPWTVYYAHLDEHKVKRGQFVKKGEVIGTVGNTGNARYTPAHLHFGIYTWLGAINPLPYVKNAMKIAVPFIAKAPAADIAKTNKKIIKEQKITPAKPASVFPQQYVMKTITLPADPSAQYYVTIKSNVVRVHEGKYRVVGKWLKGTNAKYPYRIALVNKQQVYVDKAGRLLTPKGTAIGKVS